MEVVFACYWQFSKCISIYLLFTHFVFQSKKKNALSQAWCCRTHKEWFQSLSLSLNTDIRSVLSIDHSPERRCYYCDWKSLIGASLLLVSLVIFDIFSYSQHFNSHKDWATTLVLVTVHTWHRWAMEWASSPQTTSPATRSLFLEAHLSRSRAPLPLPLLLLPHRSCSVQTNLRYSCSPKNDQTWEDKVIAWWLTWSDSMLNRCHCLYNVSSQVCREFQRGNCARGETDCRFAHPSDSPMIDTTDNTVTVCMDYIKSRCSREKCKYFHPPAHLQAKIKSGQQQVNHTAVAAQAAAAAMVRAHPPDF